jgi:quercetin dioxygenase-like cupin family protein
MATAEPMEGLADRLRGERLDIGRWSNGPGDRYAAHDHPYDKVIVVERGSIRFDTRAQGFDLEAGDRLELPAATRHAAVVGQSGVACLEAHLPVGTLAEARVRPAGTW